MIKTQSDVVVGVDGDDTLWHMERAYHAAQQAFATIVKDYADAEEAERVLLDVEGKNVDLLGYGIKSFTISMVEAAVSLSSGTLPATKVSAIVDLGKSMLQEPAEPIEGVAETLATLQGRYRLILITKGELRDQERRVREASYAPFFEAVEIVSEKDEATYRRVLAAHDVAIDRFVMVGNSVRSDINPVVAIGGRAFHIPYHVTWAHEDHALPPSASSASAAERRVWALASFREVPETLARIFQS